MEWLRHLYDDRRASRPRATASSCRISRRSGREGYVEMPAPKRPRSCSPTSAPIRSGNALRTPSGKIEIFSETHRVVRLRRLPRPSGLDRAGRMARRAAGRALSAAPDLEPAAHAAAQPARPRRGQPRGQGRRAASRCWIIPQDAAARGIADGDVVRVFNDRGACLAGAVVTDGDAPRRGAAPDRRLVRPDRAGRHRHARPARQSQRADARQGHVETGAGADLADHAGRTWSAGPSRCRISAPSINRP